MNTLDAACKLIQVIVALGIFNVWFLRLNKPTNYRGGDAKTMEEEFRVYGFSKQFMISIGTVKVFLASLLLLGLWYAPVAFIGAVGMTWVMLAAVVMHLKVSDPVRKAVPAFLMFLMSAFVAASTLS